MTFSRLLAFTLAACLALGCGDKDTTDDSGPSDDTQQSQDGECADFDCADFPTIFEDDYGEECDVECVPGSTPVIPEGCGEVDDAVCMTHCSDEEWYQECEWDDLCTATCEHIYDATECNIQKPGSTQEELKDECFNYCIDAAKIDGDPGTYTPTEPLSASESVYLENRAQVELWSDCVGTMSCDDLDDGYCAPIW